MNQIDISRLPNLSEEEKKLVSFMLRMRALAGAALIAVAAWIAVASWFGPSGESVAAARAAPPSGTPADSSLMALEHGRAG